MYPNKNMPYTCLSCIWNSKLVCTCWDVQIQWFWYYGFEPQGHSVTTVAPSAAALSQPVAAADSVSLPRQPGKRVLGLQVVCLWEEKWNRGSALHWCIDLCAFHLWVHVVVCVCAYDTQSALVYACVCVGVGVWCSDVQYECGSLLCLSLRLWLWQPPRPPRSCCHMLAASVSAEQKP